MAHRHISPRLFDAVLRGEATAAQIEELVRHLMEACPDCAHSVETEWALETGMAGSPVIERRPGDDRPGQRSAAVECSGETAPEEMDAVFQRIRARIAPTVQRVEQEQAQATARLQELIALPPQRRQLLVRNSQQFRSLPLAERLLDRAWQVGLEEASEAEPLVQLALEIVESLDADYLSEQILNDVRGRAWGIRGNFARIQADLRGAERAFDRARQLLAQGTGDPLERARLLTLESTLRRMQMQQDLAAELIDDAIRIYRRLHETHLVGRTMVSRALLLNEMGDPERAIDVLREARGLIDPQREPYLDRIVQQNLVVYLSECGRYEEAQRLIPALRGRVVQHGTRAELLRLRWQEAKIHVGLGNMNRAEAAFLEVRKGFLELGLQYDIACVTLELAALYMRQRRTAEIRELASQMFPIFQSRDLHQEAIAALLLFQRAVEMDTLTLRMVEEVADVVRRSQEKPRPQTPEPS